MVQVVFGFNRRQKLVKRLSSFENDIVNYSLLHEEYSDFKYFSIDISKYLQNITEMRARALNANDEELSQIEKQYQELRKRWEEKYEKWMTVEKMRILERLLPPFEPPAVDEKILDDLPSDTFFPPPFTLGDPFIVAFYNGPRKRLIFIKRSKRW